MKGDAREIDSTCRTDGNSNGRCVPRPAFHAVPDGTYDSLAETFNSIDALSTDAAIDLLRVYSNCDASGRDAVAKTFYALSGESFDSYLMTASEVCKKTLGMLEPDPPQPAKAKNLSQKTMSSREASNRLSDEIGVKPCTRDEGTVGDS